MRNPLEENMTWTQAKNESKNQLFVFKGLWTSRMFLKRSAPGQSYSTHSVCALELTSAASETPSCKSEHSASCPGAIHWFHQKLGPPPLQNTKVILYSFCPLSFPNSSPKYPPILFSPFLPRGHSFQLNHLSKDVASVFQVVSLLPKPVATNPSSILPKLPFQKLNLSMPLFYLNLKSPFYCVGIASNGL